eukprot:1588605-Prymnesium_polylepis.1
MIAPAQLGVEKSHDAATNVGGTCGGSGDAGGKGGARGGSDGKGGGGGGSGGHGGTAGGAGGGGGAAEVTVTVTSSTPCSVALPPVRDPMKRCQLFDSAGSIGEMETLSCRVMPPAVT